MSATRATVSAAEAVLRGRQLLPEDSASWGRAWGLSVAEADKLVRAERKRRTTLTAPA